MNESYYASSLDTKKNERKKFEMLTEEKLSRWFFFSGRRFE